MVAPTSQPMMNHSTTPINTPDKGEGVFFIMAVTSIECMMLFKNATAVSVLTMDRMRMQLM